MLLENKITLPTWAIGLYSKLYLFQESQSMTTGTCSAMDFSLYGAVAALPIYILEATWKREIELGYRGEYI